MKLLFLMFVWLVMAFLLVAGVLLAVHGNFWLLGFGLLGFAVAVAKIACLSH
jgi:hypothetical protein